MTLPPTLQHHGWTESMRRWIGLAGWPSVFASLTSLATLIGLSLLLRELPASEAGSLALLLSLSDILSLLALLGGGTVITRLYAAAGPGVFDWRRDLAQTAAYAAPLVALCTMGLALLYGFIPSSALYLLTVTFLATLLAAASAMLNSQGHHASAAVLLRAPNAFLLVPGLLALFYRPEISLLVVLLAHLTATAFSLFIATMVLLRTLPIGPQGISRSQRLSGMAFLASSVTDLLPEQGLIAVAGRILPLNQVAAFAAVAVLTRPFRLLRNVLAMILAPDLVRFRRSSYRRLLAGIWGLALACGLAAAILVPPIATQFYGARYQEAMTWIPYLSLAGVLLIAVVPPRADLGVRAPIRFVNRFALTYFLAMMGSLTLTVLGMQLWGAVFLGIAVVLLQLTETGVAYTFWLGFRQSEKRSATE